LIGSCLFYAFRKYFRTGGYLLVRKSRFGWWPHFLHMDGDGNITGWQPDTEKMVWWKPWEILIYKGYIKKGDEK